jgi:DHA2 family multidrug resistance protein-like MFS transporter
LLDLKLLSEARLARALFVILLGYFAFSGVSFVVVQYLQLARARSALDAGLLGLPLPIALLVGTLLAPRFISRITAQRTLPRSLGVALLGAVLLACATSRRSELLLCLALVPFGAGCGSAFATATELTLGAVSQERAAMAAAISESAFEFGGVLGVAISSTLLGNVARAGRDSLANSARDAICVAALALVAALVSPFAAAR